MARIAALALACMGAASGARSQDGLVLYGAGSLREAMTEIADTFGKAHGTTVRTTFAASGRMRERIEAGDPVDVFTSADIGHARTLVRDGRARVMAMFARNALCLLAPSRVGAPGPDDVRATILRPDLRIGVSPPRIDPLGDYTETLFGLLARTGATPADRAVVVDNPPGAPPARSGDAMLDAIAERRIDIAIVYCSGRDRYARLSADVAVIRLPEDWQVGPEYGLAVTSDRPQAALLALAILSPDGQAILARHGFVPVGLPAGP